MPVDQENRRANGRVRLRLPSRLLPGWGPLNVRNLGVSPILHRDPSNRPCLYQYWFNCIHLCEFRYRTVSNGWFLAF